MSAEIKLPLYAKLSICCLGFCAFVLVLFITQNIILPIVYSLIIAIILSPTVAFLETRMSRLMAITLIVFILLIIAVLVIGLLSSQIMQFTDSFPLLNNKLHKLVDEIVQWASTHFKISTDRINLWVNEKSKEIANEVSSTIAKTIIGTGNFLVVFMLVLAYTFMFLYYQPLLSEFIKKLFKTNERAEINEVLTATRKLIRSYLVGLLLEALIIAVLDASVLLILGIDYAILLGVIGAILNMIPFIGGIIAVSLPTLIALATQSPSYALLVIVFYIIIQFIDNHYIVPKIVASKVKINALVSVIVVLIGGALWGIPGMFLSIPITAIVKLVFDRVDFLKPWGYLLGDNMPPLARMKSPYKKKPITVNKSD